MDDAAGDSETPDLYMEKYGDLGVVRRFTVHSVWPLLKPLSSGMVTVVSDPRVFSPSTGDPSV